MTRYMQAALLVAKWLLPPAAFVLAIWALLWLTVNQIIPIWVIPGLAALFVVGFAARVMFDLALLEVDKKRRWDAERDEP